jgi:hypothetical protein
MSYNPQNPNGQATSANSSPVVLSSDQSAVPVSASALPLPTGAATAANQTSGNTSLTTLATNLPAKGQATMANSMPVVIAGDQSTISTDHAKTAGATTSVNNGASDAGTQRVTISNDSTGQVIVRGNVASATTDSGNPVKVGGRYNSAGITLTDGQRGDLQLDASGNLKTTTSGTMTIAANSSVNVAQLAGTTTDTNSGAKSAGTLRVVLATDQPQLTSALKVDGSAVTQPVSGTVTVQQATASSLKVDLSGTAVNTTALKVDASATTQPVSATALPLPTGAATSAAQTTGNSSLSTLATNVPSKGQATMANSMPVAIASDQTAINVALVPSTANGWLVNSQTVMTNTKVTVKGSAGLFAGYMIYNPNSSVCFVQVFDVANASITLGTTTPTYVIPVPAAAAANIEFSVGIAHTTAIVVAATTTANGSTAPAVGLASFFLYK